MSDAIRKFWAKFILQLYLDEKWAQKYSYYHKKLSFTRMIIKLPMCHL